MAFHYDLDLDLGFSRWNLKNAVSQEWEGPLTRNERDELIECFWPYPWPMAVTLDFQGKILKLMYLRNGRVDSLGMKGMWVGCSMGLTLDHVAWQIEWPSNGSMWNSYRFQPVGQWMGYLFTDLEAEGCCRSLNALLPSVCGGIKDVDPSPELLLQSLWMAWNCWCILTTLKTD